MLIITVIIITLFFLLLYHKIPTNKYYSHHNPNSSMNSKHLTQPKPKWVKKIILKIAAQNPSFGCRKIAFEFNRAFAHKETVSKSFVASFLKKNQYAVLELRKKYKHKIPKPQKINHTWAMDFTGLHIQNQNQNILGILDHGSRICLCLKTLPHKSTLQIIKSLIFCFEKFGLPKAIKTDNEAIFCSYKMKLFLWLIGIKQIRSALHSPWQNGRIERFLGTLKEKIRQVNWHNSVQLTQALPEFQFWYNFCRPHQHLGGLTPMEYVQNINLKENKPKQIEHNSFWGGLLTGFYIRR